MGGPVEAPLEQKHLYEIRIRQNRNGVVALRELHHGKPRLIVSANDKARKG
jgi:hypothetical protein